MVANLEKYEESKIKYLCFIFVGQKLQPTLDVDYFHIQTAQTDTLNRK